MPTFNFSQYANGTPLNSIDANWTVSAGVMPSVSSARIAVPSGGLVLYNDGAPLSNSEATIRKSGFTGVRVAICSTGLNSGYEARLDGSTSIKLMRNGQLIYSANGLTNNSLVKIESLNGTVRLWVNSSLKTTYFDANPLSGFVAIPAGTSKSIIVGPKQYDASFTGGYSNAFGSSFLSAQIHNASFSGGFSSGFASGFGISEVVTIATVTASAAGQLDLPVTTTGSYSWKLNGADVDANQAFSQLVDVGDTIELVSSESHLVTKILWHNKNISGDISSWILPAALTYLYLHGTSVSGDISSWTLPATLAFLYLHGTSVSGDISSWTLPAALTFLYLYGTSVSGDISSWTLPATLAILHLGSTSVSGVLAPAIDAAIYAHSAQMTRSDIEQSLSILAAGGISNKVVHFGGSNPRVSAELAINELVARGNAVTANRFYDAVFGDGFASTFGALVTVSSVHDASFTGGTAQAFGTAVTVNEIHQADFTSGFAHAFGEPMKIAVDGWVFSGGFAPAFSNPPSIAQLHSAGFSGGFAQAFASAVAANEIHQAGFTGGFAQAFGESIAIDHSHSVTFTGGFSQSFGTPVAVSPTHEIAFTDGFSRAFGTEFKALPHELVYFADGFSQAFGLDVSVSPTHSIDFTDGFSAAFGTATSTGIRHNAELASGFSSAFGQSVGVAVVHEVDFTGGFSVAFGEPTYAGAAIFPAHIGIAWSSTKRRLTGVEMSRSRGGKPRFVRRHHGSNEFEFDIELPWMTPDEWAEITSFHKRVGSHTAFRFLFKQLDDVVYQANFADESIEDTNPDSAEYFSTRLQLVGRALPA